MDRGTMVKQGKGDEVMAKGSPAFEF